jgi:hypothetical protein
MKAVESPIRSMAAKWPSSIVSRSEIPRFTGGLMSEKYIANLDSAGLGPSNRLRVGKKIAYPIDELIIWLEARISTVPIRGDERIPGTFPRQRRTD